MSVRLEILEYIKLIYRQVFDEKIISSKLTKGTPVVEFYLEDNQYFIDINNTVYTKDTTNSNLHGIPIGHLLDGVIFLGS
jgi:hypothetical protein